MEGNGGGKKRSILLVSQRQLSDNSSEVKPSDYRIFPSSFNARMNVFATATFLISEYDRVGFPLGSYLVVANSLLGYPLFGSFLVLGVADKNSTRYPCGCLDSLCAFSIIQARSHVSAGNLSKA